jgi:hypothetical protein
MNVNDQGNALGSLTSFGYRIKEDPKRMKAFWDARGILQRYFMM